MRSVRAVLCLASLLIACAPRVAEPEPAERAEGAEHRAAEPVPDPEPVPDSEPVPEPEPVPDSEPDPVPEPNPEPVPVPPPPPPRADLPQLGPPLSAADPSDAEVDAAPNSFLTNHARAECSIDTPLSWLHDRCRIVRPTRVSTSASDSSTLVHAFDLDACTTFVAGDAPQVIELELARAELLDLLVIDPGPRSSGASRHIIETPDRRGRWVPRTVLFGGYYDSVLYALRFPEPIRASRIRIRTIQSPGLIELREVVPVVCAGEVAIHIEGVPPDPPPPPPPRIDWHDPRYTHVAGAGRCRSDADCAPQSCCGGSSCGLRRTAPDCDGVGCGQGCGSPLDCGHGACICHEGVCSLATTYSPRDLGLAE